MVKVRGKLGAAQRFRHADAVWADLFRAPPGDTTVVTRTLGELARHSNPGSNIRTKVRKVTRDA